MEGVSEWGMSVIKGNSCDVQEGLRRELKQLLAAELELSKYYLCVAPRLSSLE